MKDRERNDFTGFACDTCNTKFDADHELRAHQQAIHGGQSDKPVTGKTGAGSQGSTGHTTGTAEKKPGVEPADNRETTELPPGANKARAGRN